jgi:hypothetical protein
MANGTADVVSAPALHASHHQAGRPRGRLAASDIIAKVLGIVPDRRIGAAEDCVRAVDRSAQIVRVCTDQA